MLSIARAEIKPERAPLFLASAAIGGMDVLGLILDAGQVGQTIYSSPFVLIVALVTIRLGWAAGMLAAVLSCVSLKFLFIPPKFGFAVPTAREMWAHLSLLATPSAIRHILGGRQSRVAVVAPYQRRHKLPFVMRVNGVKDFWDTIEASGDWLADAEIGREYGRLYLDRLEAGSAPLMSWVVQAMIAKGNYGGIEAGFLSVINDKLRQDYHADKAAAN